MSHTPGPWHIVEGTEFVSDSHHMAICRVNRTVEVDTVRGVTVDSGPRSREPNARLISAAPELLEACKAFVEIPDVQNEQEWPEVKLARAAIAKATGRLVLSEIGGGK